MPSTTTSETLTNIPIEPTITQPQNTPDHEAAKQNVLDNGMLLQELDGKLILIFKEFDLNFLTQKQLTICRYIKSCAYDINIVLWTDSEAFTTHEMFHASIITLIMAFRQSPSKECLIICAKEMEMLYQATVKKTVTHVVTQIEDNYGNKLTVTMNM
jgi:hypothetical protein